MQKHSLFKRLDWPFYRAALALAIPIALQNLLTSSANLVDGMMVVALGNAATSAVGVAGRFAFLINIICFGFASGCAALLSQYWGAKDLSNVRRSAGFALLLAMSVGVLYAVALYAFAPSLVTLFTGEGEVVSLAVSYLRIFSLSVPLIVFSQIMCTALRATENVAVPLLSSAAQVGVNVFFNWCLIFGNLGLPALGLRGAAVSSVLAAAVQAAVVVAAVFFTQNPFRVSPRALFALDRPFCSKYLRVALPVLLNETMWGIGTNIYAMVYGHQGVENHAGYTIFENVQQIFFVFFVGICSACSVMVGMRIGKGDAEGGYVAARRFAVMTPLFGLFFGLVMFLVREPLLSLFPIETAAARQTALDCLTFYSFWLPVRMVPYTLICGVFRAGGDTKASCFFDLVGLWVFGIPAVLVLDLFIHPPRFVFLLAAAFMAEDVIKSLLCVWHFRSRRWIRRLTAPAESLAEKKPARH